MKMISLFHSFENNYWWKSLAIWPGETDQGGGWGGFWELFTNLCISRHPWLHISKNIFAYPFFLGGLFVCDNLWDMGYWCIDDQNSCNLIASFEAKTFIRCGLHRKVLSHKNFHLWLLYANTNNEVSNNTAIW